MRKQVIQVAVVAFFMVPVLSSCDPCEENKSICPNTDNRDAYIRIKSADGKDLLFGPQKRYNASSTRFYSVKGNVTSYFESETEISWGINPDSFLVASFRALPDTAYMRLSDGDIDTLALRYHPSGGGKCCPATTDLINIRLNGKTDHGGNSAQFIK